MTSSATRARSFGLIREFVRIATEAAALPCGMRYKPPDRFAERNGALLASVGLSVRQCAAPAAPDSHRRVPVRREPGEPGTHLALAPSRPGLMQSLG
ncbi:hypothetical protein GCM10010448_46390 [Streptomyces glomeratus]|uniref:Uncharacterized protein n=1 Tax=Streptomyces glomeratus TaxID=284452 RepID=A0ABP6LRZ0_9ACTN